MIKKIILIKILLSILCGLNLFAYDWVPGRVDIYFHEEYYIYDILDDFIQRYSQYELEPYEVRESRNSASFKFNNDNISDEDFVELVKQDPYVRSANLIYYGGLGEEGHYVYPNPSNGDYVRFASAFFSNRGVEISIYNIRGQLVKKANYDDLTPRKTFYIWHKNDMNGNLVAPGVYIYIIKKGDYYVQRGKLTILK